MTSRGYIWLGIGCAALAVVVLLMAHSDDELQRSIARAQVAVGVAPDPESDMPANLVGLGLFAVSGVLILIGAIGAGVKAGNREN